MAKKTIKLQRGTIYQKEDNGIFFFRFQTNGQRKATSLQTKNLKEAKEKAEQLMPVINANSLKIVAAHVSQANFGARKQQTLRLSDAWQIYNSHPDKATPSTVAEQLNYQVTWRDFINFVADDLQLEAVTAEIAFKYADHMRTQTVAVDTHNRKIRRLKKIFATLKGYYSGENPFASSVLMRKDREEQDNPVRRLSFSKEEEQRLLAVLDDDKYKVVNKPEIKVLYYLGIFTGQRMKDCALLRWDKINFERKRLWVKQFKTGKEVTIPMATRLQEVLMEAKAWRQKDDYVLPAIAERYQQEDPNGKNIGSNLVTKDLLRVIRWIGLEPSVKIPGRKKMITVYGFHSLRHSFASHCAEAGVPKAVVLSILGTASDIIDKYYVHIGEDAQLKAIEAISLGNGNDAYVSPQSKIDKALELISKLETKSAEIKAVENLLR